VGLLGGDPPVIGPRRTGRLGRERERRNVIGRQGKVPDLDDGADEGGRSDGSRRVPVQQQMRVGGEQRQRRRHGWIVVHRDGEVRRAQGLGRRVVLQRER